MANWCSNFIAIYKEENSQKAEQELKELYIKIKSLGTPSTVYSDPIYKDYQSWYGMLGVIGGGKLDDIDCRGSIEDVAWNKSNLHGVNESWIKIYTTTAWEPQIEIIDMMLEKYLYLGYEYESEECGNQIYINTDTEGVYLNDRYMIDYDLSVMIAGCCDMEYFSNVTSFFDYVKKIGCELETVTSKGKEPFKLKCSALTIEEAAFDVIDQINKYLEDTEFKDNYYISAHKFDEHGS